MLILIWACNQCLAWKTPVVKVDSLPFDINGEAVYQVPYPKDKRMKAVADERPWDRDMPIKGKGAGKGSVRAQRCKGSYECKNPKCSFKLLQSAKVFKLKTSQKRTCRSRSDSGRHWKSILYGANNWVNATSHWILKVERSSCFCWVTCFNSYRLSFKRKSSIKVVNEPLGDEDMWHECITQLLHDKKGTSCLDVFDNYKSLE